MVSDFKAKYSDFISDYARIEAVLQNDIAEACRLYCRECSDRCCKEPICRESIESPFLAILVAEQGAEYDDGWMGAAGCRLKHGRPPVCYEFFCNRILQKDEVSELRRKIKAFVDIGVRIRGNQHLVCVDDLSLISESKMQKAHRKVLDMLGSAC